MSMGLFKTESWATVQSEASFGNGLELLWGFYIVSHVWFSLKEKEKLNSGSESAVSSYFWEWLKQIVREVNKETLLQTSVWHAQGQNQPNRTSTCQGWFCHVASPRLLKLGRSRWLENPCYHNNVCNSTRYTPTQAGEKGYLCSAEMIPSVGLPRVSSCVHRLSSLRFK